MTGADPNLTESDAGALEFPLYEGMAVEPVGGMKGKETGHADDDRPQPSPRM